ncbi:MAG: YdeI/OmpD-associated family protein [Cytophagales bacterium]|nr:YdeI/OmpD-associated family protein [Cytophagales bacterium]
MNPKVNFYFEKATKWKEEVSKLREIALASGLTEELKWGCPSYGLNNKNVVLIHDFKEYCALLFFKGALMSDPQGLLIQQTENVQAARQMRFTHWDEIRDREDIIQAYIAEAIEIEKKGLQVELKRPSEFAMAEEFQVKLDQIPGLKAAFESLTPGRQRAYLLHFSSPKQSKTRESRVENCIPKILQGKGLDD